MARTKSSTEGLMSISGSVPPSLHAAMEDERWGRKFTMSQFVRHALEDFATREGFWKQDATELPDGEELTDAQREAIAADDARAAEVAEQAEAEAKAAAEDKAAEDAAKVPQGVSDDAPEQETSAKPTSRSRK